MRETGGSEMSTTENTACCDTTCCGGDQSTVTIGAAAAVPDEPAPDDAEAIRATVREKYGQAALRAGTGGSSCCGAAASCGCADPTALAELGAGETVLDLGSGGGIDVLLSARRVGPTGKAYGLDMT